MKRQRVAMFGQLRTMRGQLAEMESSGKQTEKLIEHAGTQSGAAADHAKAALLSADALVGSERPWIIVTARMGKSAPIKWYFEAKNRGRTPGRIVSEEIGDAFVPDPANLPIPPHYTNSPLHQGLIVEDGDFPIYIIDTDRFIFNRDMKGAVAAGNQGPR